MDFITSGNPGWARYDTARRTTGLLTDAISAADDPAGDERALWNGIRWPRAIVNESGTLLNRAILYKSPNRSASSARRLIVEATYPI